jgi:hypothetical protein
MNNGQRVALVLSSLGLLVGGLPAATATAAPPQHLTGEFRFPDNVCGFSGVSDVTFIDNFGTKSDGSSYDAGRVYQTFTADDGQEIVISFAGNELNAPPQTNPDGTTTYVDTYNGSQTKIQAKDGAVLEQNAGRLQTTAILGADGSLISFSLQVLAGPNPSPGLPDCSVVGPYLGD